MLQTFTTLLTASVPIHFAQQPVSPLPISGSRFFFTVLAGLVLTFAFQMLLTNFSIALGISILGTGKEQESQQESHGTGFRTIGIAMGVWTLVSVSLALFGACALALKLSLIATPLQAITLALVIWATYFTVLVWVSSTTVGSLIGSVVSTATASFQSIFGTATAILGAKAARSEIVATAEEAVAAVRRQVTADIDAEDLQDSLKDYLGQLRSPNLELSDLRQEFEELLKDPQVSELDTTHLQQINRDAFEKMIRDRTDVSKRDRQLLVNRMERAWNQAISGHQKRDRMGELIEFAKQSTSQSLLSEGLATQLEQLIREHRERQEGPDTNLLTQGINTLMAIIAGRLDLSDFEVGKISSQLKQAKEQVMDQVDQAYLLMDSDAEPPTVIGTDVENYILNTAPWRFTPQDISHDFRNVLFDPSANLETIKRQVSGLSTQNFKALLKSRGIFTQAKIEQIDRCLQQTCQSVLIDITATLDTRKRKALAEKTYTYLYLTPPEQLTTDHIRQSFAELIKDDEAEAETLKERFIVLNRTELMKPLQARQDVSPEEINRIINDLQWVIERTIADAKSLKAAAEVRVKKQWEEVQTYLRNTGKAELNPQGIQRDIQKLLDDPQAGLQDLQVRLSHFDRDTLIQLLSQRQDLSDAEVQKTLDSVEQSWHKAKHAPELLTAKAKSKYQDATNAIAQYLRNTGKTELHPEGIQRDLKLLLEDPQAGYEAIYDRLSRMDRDTLVQLISQREDMTEAEVNETIDQVQSTLQQLVNAPRRLAKRSRAKIESFQSSLEDYLRSTDKAELNPEGIKRDLQALINDPRWGLQRLGDRLTSMDESTLVALLSQRDDMTETEAQEAVAKIVTVRDEIQQNIAKVTNQVKSVIDAIMNRIRRYLNGLERPELNYEAVRQDIQTLFDDPEAGFEALRNRLSRFDRETLVAVVSSHDNISEQDANHVINQIEATRSSILQRAERAQMRFQERMEQLKRQAEAQVEATQKTAAIAAWWLLATAVASGAAATVGAIVAI